MFLRQTPSPLFLLLLDCEFQLERTNNTKFIYIFVSAWFQEEYLVLIATLNSGCIFLDEYSHCGCNKCGFIINVKLTSVGELLNDFQLSSWLYKYTSLFNNYKLQLNGLFLYLILLQEELLLEHFNDLIKFVKTRGCKC